MKMRVFGATVEVITSGPRLIGSGDHADVQLVLPPPSYLVPKLLALAGAIYFFLRREKKR